MRKHRKFGTIVVMIILILFLLGGAISFGITSNNAAMLFEDDFNDGIIDPNWMVQQASGMSIVEENGVLRMSATATQEYWQTQGLATLNNLFTSFVVESRFKMYGTGTGSAAVIAVGQDANNYFWFGINTDPVIGGFGIQIALNGTTTNYPLGAADTNYHVYKIEYNENTAKFYIDGVLRKTLNLGLTNVTVSLHANARAIGDTVDVQFDNFSLQASEANQPPVASFTYSPEKPMVGGNITFDASSSYDSDGTIVSYEWDFGDGTSDPPCPDPNTTHMFTTPGKYTVTLTVTDNNGLTNSKLTEVNLTLENGDLLLCRDFASWVPGFWSHVGIYDKVSNTVIEARPIEGGVWHYPLSDWFFPNRTCVRALRINTSQAVKDAAVAFASAQADSWSPFDLFSLFIPPLLGMKNQDNSDGLGWYCSELVWAAYLWGSNGSVNLDMDAFAVSPDEIAHSSWVQTVVGEHRETEPDTVYQGGGVLFGEALCPINLLITDPDGLVLSKSVNAIPGAVYRELDFDHDGDLDDAFMIPERKMGGYSIGVIPEPNALPTDTYSLEVMINGQTMVLAQDVQIQNIPSEPYIIESKLNSADFDNDGDVDFYDYAIFANRWSEEDCNYPDWCEGTDLDYGGAVDFMDLYIFAENWLWEKIPADLDIDGNVDFTDFNILANQWLNDCNSPDWRNGCDLDKSGVVEMLDLLIFASHWLETAAP